jgi:predicted AAA+ superfamily ATPase
MIGELKKIYDNLLASISLDFQRDVVSSINPTTQWPIAIIGERWIGKTYLLLQLLKQSPLLSFYFSADNTLVQGIWLFKLVSQLYFDYNIRIIGIDEIHKWDQRINNIKSIIDSFPDLQLIISWSSSLDLYKWTSDLQRRIHSITMNWLSFTEFLRYEKKLILPNYTFDQLITNYQRISFELSSQISLSDFKEYLTYGYYPYFRWKQDIYHSLLLSNLKKTILEDLPTFMNLETTSLSKLEKLFFFIAKNQPSDLNYKSLATMLNISKDLLETIIYYLDQIGVLNIAVRSNKLSEIMRKEFKIFLGNPNIYYAFGEDIKIGTIRESFVLSALKQVNNSQVINNSVILPDYGDFILNYKNIHYLFEVWWATKTNRQIQWIAHSFCVKDSIIIAESWVIPLWMFGLLHP